MQFLYEEFKKYGSVSIDTEGRSAPEVSIDRKTIPEEIVATLRGIPAMGLLWVCVLFGFVLIGGAAIKIAEVWSDLAWLNGDPHWDWVGLIVLIWTLSVAAVGSYFNQRDAYHIGTAVKEHLRWQRIRSALDEEIRNRRQLVNQLEDDLIANGYSDAAALLKSYGELKSRTSIATYDDYLDSLEDEED